MDSPNRSRHLPCSPPRIRCDSMMFRFPARLWRIVNSCRNGAISWGPNGKTLRILKTKFEKDYLQADIKPFKTEYFASFIRQLNLYGFKKVSAPMVLDGEHIDDYDNLYEYRHPLFRQGKAELLPYLHRNCKSKSRATQQMATEFKTVEEQSSSNFEIKMITREVLADISESVYNTGKTNRTAPDKYHSIYQKSAREEDGSNLEFQENMKIKKKTISNEELENHPLLRPVTKTTPMLQINPRLQQISEAPKSSKAFTYGSTMFLPVSRSPDIFNSLARSQHGQIMGRYGQTNSKPFAQKEGLFTQIPGHDRPFKLEGCDDHLNTSLNLDSFLLEHAHQPPGLGDTEEMIEEDRNENRINRVTVDEAADKNDIYYLNKSIERNASFDEEEKQIVERDTTSDSGNNLATTVGETAINIAALQDLQNTITVASQEGLDTDTADTVESNMDINDDNSRSPERFISIDINNLLINNTESSDKSCHLIQLDSAIIELVKQNELTKASWDALSLSSNGVLGYVILPTQ